MRGAAAFVDSGRWTTHKCYNLYSAVKMLTTSDGRESRFLPTPPVFDAPIRRALSEYCQDVWYGKNKNGVAARW